jgi:hypothetical protein
MATRIFSERQTQAALITFAAVLLQGTAGLAFAAVYGFDVSNHADLDVLVRRGPGVGAALRAALLVDMLGYLAVAPVVIHLHGRLRSTASGSPAVPWLMDVVAFFGLVFCVVGAIGAVFLALAGPSLVDAAAAGGSAETAARVAFSAISRAVDEGLWGPLEWVAAAIWVGGIGWFVRGQGRPFALTAMAAAIGLLAYATRIGLTGRNPVETAEPIDLLVVAALGVFAIWELWLAIRLWRGR